MALLASLVGGTPGVALDALARSALWAVGLDYLHGTGHGIGSYLSVHEGPQGISKKPLLPRRSWPNHPPCQQK